jgi:cohesin complex subunit SA-1/2
MSSFFTRLFAASAVSEILYDTAFCQTLQAWLTSLSSSKIRSFRHTATVLCLIAVSALCDVSVAVNKEFASASRAKEAEEKKGKKDQARLKALKLTVKGLHVKKEQLEQYLSDIFEA